MYYIGIDLGGTNIKVGLVDDSGVILQSKRKKTFSERCSAEIISDMAELSLSLIAEVGKENVGGIGIGCPGAIDSADGQVIFSGNLKWNNVQVVARMREKIANMPIYLCNDANVAALGEATFGVGKEYGDSILITLGTGVGGGIVIWDKMFEGNKSSGAEIGHMVIEVDGEPCTCGRKGCFEAYSSATALIRDTKRAMEKNPNSAMWKRVQSIDCVDGLTAFECSKQGDSAAKQVVERYIKYLGEGVVNLANVLRPEVIMLGGGVSAQGETLIAPLQKYIDEHVFGKTKTARVLVMQAKLGNDAGIIGAATLAMKGNS